VLRPDGLLHANGAACLLSPTASAWDSSRASSSGESSPRKIQHLDKYKQLVTKNASLWIYLPAIDMFSVCSYDPSVSGLGGSIFDIVYLATGEPSRFALEGGAEGIAARVFQRKVDGNPRVSAAMRKVVFTVSRSDPPPTNDGSARLLRGSAPPRDEEFGVQRGRAGGPAPLDMGSIARNPDRA
jgi:hypothetical protein